MHNGGLQQRLQGQVRDGIHEAEGMLFGKPESHFQEKNSKHPHRHGKSNRGMEWVAWDSAQSKLSRGDTKRFSGMKES